MYEEIFSILSEYFDESESFKHVAEIHGNDYWFDYSHFGKTAEYCFKQMKNTGLSDVELIPLKADGRTAYGDWVVPRAWDASGAALKVVNSDGTCTVLADYEKTPCSLMMYSAPTPLNGVEAEVVLIGGSCGTFPEDVKGKIIFTHDRPQNILPMARAGGAAGIVSDFLPVFPGVRDDKTDAFDAFRWENVFISPVNDTDLFGFSLSPRIGEELKKRIEEAAQKGEAVFLHAEVNTRFYDGTVYTLSGMIPGTNPAKEEVLICGHLYEFGANDNASGCGVMLELAAAITRTINEGKLPRPKRNIRFVMGFECVGLMAYCVKYSERIKRTIGAINVDMIGSAIDDKAKLHLFHNPISNWSYTDTLIVALTNALRTYLKGAFDFLESDFEICDNLIADPMFNVPTAAMLMLPSLSYHSSMDTMERVDPKVLLRNALICGGFLYFMADPEEEDIRWLLKEIKEHAVRMVNGSIKKDEARAYLLSEAFYKGTLALKCLLGNGSIDILSDIEMTAKELPRMPEPEITGIKDEKLELTARKFVPERKIMGSLTLYTLNREIRESIRWSPFYNYAVNCPLFWTDGKRNLLEIAILTAIELRRDDLQEVLCDLMEYYKFLKKYEYIEM